jgi:hypothetical protein
MTISTGRAFCRAGIGSGGTERYDTILVEEDMVRFYVRLVALAAAFGAVFIGCVVTDARADNVGSVETIVLFRHGEKPAGGLGQLNVKGLNRSLALPNILIGKYGKPNYIFAPNPSVLVDSSANNPGYSYVRPLATIEPTAILLGMPVNTQIGFNAIDQLQTEMAKPMYAGAVIFIAWEHGYLDVFAKNMVKAYGGDPSMVPSWPENDFDTIFVIRLTHTGASTSETFSIDHEGLNQTLSDNYPSPPAQ